MTSERGSALILALLILTFLMILGSALLTSVTLDVTIGENYRAETQLLYLAEAGIQEAKVALRDSADTPSQLLAAAAGSDGVLSSSRDLDTLLSTSDDVAFINGGSRSVGRLLVDTSGGPAGRFYVFLRNDSADGITSLTDTNQVLTLLCVAIIGNARKVLEVTVMKWKFPPLLASLILDGSPVMFTPGSGTEIYGMDSTGKGDNRNAMGVLTETDRASVLAAIPLPDQTHFSGVDSPSPPPADIGILNGMLDPRLNTPSGVERIIDSIVSNASATLNPGWNGTAYLGNMGSATDDRIVVVNGDCEFGSGSGYGILLVRGNLILSGSFHWNGLILVVGQGTVVRSGTGNGVISGGVFVARTRAVDRSAINELGTLLLDRGAVTADFSGVGTNLQIINPGKEAAERIYQKLPYVPIAIREY